MASQGGNAFTSLVGPVDSGRPEAVDGAGVLPRSKFFSGISPDEFSWVCGAAQVKQFDRGEMLHVEGDAVKRVLLLTGGIAKITARSPSGREVILRLSAAGYVLGAVCMFSSGRHTTTAQSFRSCRTLMWDEHAFKALVERFPILHLNALAILGEELRELEERFREVATERVSARVAMQLLRLRQMIGRPVQAGGIEVGVSREELAQMTGTTLFTVSRLLSAWEVRGIVRPLRGGVAICNAEMLGTISQEDVPEK